MRQLPTNLLLAIVLLTAGRLTLQAPPLAPGQSTPATGPVGQAVPEKQALRDIYGDPLPPGALARLGTVRFRHSSWVTAVTYLPGGKELIASCWDGSIQVWDTHGRKVRTFAQNHGNVINALVLSPDGRTAVSGGNGGVCVWDVALGKQRFRLGNERTTWGLAFAPDGQILAAGYEDRLILWDVTTGKQLDRLEHKRALVTAAVFSPDGKLLAWAGGQGAFNLKGIPVADYTVHLYDLAGRKELRRLVGHGGEINALRFTADGQTLFSASSDDTVRAWTVATGQQLWQLKGDGGKERNPGFGMTKCGVRSLAVSPNGKFLAGGNYNGHIRIWEIATRKQLVQLAKHGREVNSLAFSPDGKTLASASYDLSIRLWDPATGKERFTFGGHAGFPNCAAVSPNGRWVASTGGDRTIRLWEADSGREVGVLPGQAAWNYQVRFARDSRWLASLGDDDTIQLWDRDSRKKSHVLKAPRGRLSDMAFAPNGWLLATVADGLGKVALDNGSPIHLWDVRTGQLLRTLKEGPAGTCFVSPQFSPDGQTLGVVCWANPARGLKDRFLLLLEATTGKEVGRLKTAGHRYTFLPDGKTILLEPAPGNVAVWDMRQARELYSFPLPGGHGDYHALEKFTLSPDGRMLAQPGPGNTVQLWELATGQVRREWRGHQGLITALAFFPDGKRLLSTSYDTTGLVWDVTRPGQTTGDLATLWKTLADRDAIKAYDALLALTAKPEQTVPFLRKQLRPTAPVPPEQFQKWIADLGSDRFAKRSKAGLQLRQLDRLAEPHLKSALANPQLSLEVQLRLEKLLEELRGPLTVAEHLAGLRSVEVLEHIGTPAARELLATLAQGAPGARLTSEAQAALRRLTKGRKKG